MKEKRWVIVSEKHGSQFEEGFYPEAEKEEAVKEANAAYAALSDHDKEHTHALFIGLYECEKVRGRWLIADGCFDPIESVDIK